MKITFYGRLVDVAGRDLDLSLDQPCTVAALRERIAVSCPAAANLLRDKRVRACVGSEILVEDHLVMATADVDFLAPVSGG